MSHSAPAFPPFSAWTCPFPCWPSFSTPFEQLLAHPCFLTLLSLLTGLYEHSMFRGIWTVFSAATYIFCSFSSFTFKSSLFLHRTIPPLFSFSPSCWESDAQTQTPPYAVFFSPSLFFLSDLVSIFPTFFYFIFFNVLSHSGLHHSPFHLLSTSWFRSVILNFLVFFPLFFISCIPSV